MTGDRAIPPAPRAAYDTEQAVPEGLGLGTSVFLRCRAVLTTWPGKSIMIVTVLAGVLAAVAVAAGTTAQERTIAVVSDRVQTLMSVTLPFLGVALVHAARPPARRRALVSSVLAALVFAVAVAVCGVALCVSVTAVAHFQLPAGQWDHVGTIVLGSLLVQIVAQLTGTGMGRLVRRPVIACLLTIVLPLGLWLILRAVGEIRPAQAWLTPYASAQHLLAGDMNPINWAQWLVMATIWGLGLNLAGGLAARRFPTQLFGPSPQ